MQHPRVGTAATSVEGLEPKPRRPLGSEAEKKGTLGMGGRTMLGDIRYNTGRKLGHVCT